MPDAKSGYYEIHIKNEKKEAFCDMLNYGTMGHDWIAGILFISAFEMQI